MAESLENLVMQIENLLGRSLGARDGLETALTHRSYVNELPDSDLDDNERLEFLGDAVLQLAVSDWLMREFPDESEGTLSKLRSSVVNEHSLAQTARKLDLGRFLRLGKGEEFTQGRKKDSLLANAFEAVVAAIYLDQGVEAVVRFLAPSLREAFDRADEQIDVQDFKTTLQELTQRVHSATPVYRLVSEDGPDHDKVFESEVLIEGRVYGRGSAKSKKASEQLCAQAAIQALERESAETTS